MWQLLQQFHSHFEVEACELIEYIRPHTNTRTPKQHNPSQVSRVAFFHHTSIVRYVFSRIQQQYSLSLSLFSTQFHEILCDTIDDRRNNINSINNVANVAVYMSLRMRSRIVLSQIKLFIITYRDGIFV